MTVRFSTGCTSAAMSLGLVLGAALSVSRTSGESIFAEYAAAALRGWPPWWMALHANFSRCGPTTHMPAVLRLNVTRKQGPSHSPQAAAIRSESLRIRKVPPPSTALSPLLCRAV